MFVFDPLLHIASFGFALIYIEHTYEATSENRFCVSKGDLSLLLDERKST